MFTKHIIFLFLLSLVNKIYSNLESNNEWNNFKSVYHKSYDSMEEITRKKIYKQNLVKIKQHNMEFEKGLHTYSLGVNEFMDWTQEEFNEKMRLNENAYNLSSLKRTGHLGLKFRLNKQIVLPKSLDWRDEKIVSRVKNQGECGSCWAFSVTGVLESALARLTGNVVELSEQQLVDCDKSNYGCNGGYMHNAITYAKNNGWLMTSSQYPYKGVKGKCFAQQVNSPKVKINGYEFVEYGNEMELKETLSTVGPISIAIHVSDYGNLMFYKKGVFTDHTCEASLVNHAVLLVGYGEENGVPYWLIKNSWGEKFGENGYIRMRRDANNMCGVASMSVYPLLVRSINEEL